MLTTGETGCLLVGMVLGVVLHYAALFILVGIVELRSLKGTSISGEAMERNRRRETP